MKHIIYKCNCGDHNCKRKVTRNRGMLEVENLLTCGVVKKQLKELSGK